MNRSLRVAFFAGTFPRVSETFILRQITGLLDMGHTVEMFADTRPEDGAPVHPEVSRYRLADKTTYMDLPPETVPWEMPVWPITGRTWPPGAERPVHNSVRAARAAPAFLKCLVKHPRLAVSVLRAAEYRYQASSLSVLHRLARLTSLERRFDVLHAHFGPAGNSFRFARQLWHAPLVVSFHGHDFSTLPRKEGAGMYRRLFATADAVTVNSEHTRRSVEGLGCPTAKAHKLPVGLDAQEFPFCERTVGSGAPIRLLSIGRLVEIKGHEHLIRAVAMLRPRHPRLRLDLVGDGPLRPKLERLAGELNTGGCITFHGALAGDEVKRLMSGAHLFALTSVNVDGDAEGQGLVLQEAQACGLPVVATRHGALPEGMLEGESGFIVPERDVDALAARLGWLLEHPETWPALGRSGRAFVEAHYDIHQLNHRLVQIYREAIAGFSSSPVTTPDGSTNHQT